MARPAHPVDPQESLRHLVGASIRHWREVSGMSVIDFARDLCIDPSHLSKWERGLAPVPADQISRIDTILKAGNHIVAVHAAATELEARRIRDRATVEGADPTRTDEGDMKRRAALEFLAALGAGTVIPPGVLEEILSGVERALGEHTDLGDWERAVHDYGYRICHQPAGALVSDLTADIIAVGHLLKRRHPPAVQAGLLRVSAGLSGVLAVDLGDMGNERAARRVWDTARRAADASGDRDLRVWVRGRSAMDAFGSGRSPDVVAVLADEAIDIAEGAPSAGLANAHTARAFLAAGQGDIPTARTAMSMVKRTFERLPSPPAGPMLMTVQERQLYWREAYVDTIGGYDQAGKSVERALSVYPADAMAGVTNLHLMQAKALVGTGEVVAGLQQAVSALQDGRRVVPVTHGLARQVIGALPAKARALPEARELHALTSGA